PDNTNNLTIRDAINSAIKKPLIATIEFTTNHNIRLITETILQLPLSSNPTALPLRKPSEQPYLQQPASGRMKSGTKLSSTAFLPPVPFLLFSQKSKTSTLAPTSLALLDGSPQKPSAPRNQHPPWFSLSRA